MIDRATGPAVTGALAVGAAKAAQPMIADFFGMPFEVPSVIAALFGCIVTRVIVGQSDTPWMRGACGATSGLAAGLAALSIYFGAKTRAAKATQPLSSFAQIYPVDGAPSRGGTRGTVTADLG